MGLTIPSRSFTWARIFLKPSVPKPHDTLLEVRNTPKVPVPQSNAYWRLAASAADGSVAPVTAMVIGDPSAVVARDGALTPVALGATPVTVTWTVTSSPPATEMVTSKGPAGPSAGVYVQVHVPLFTPLPTDTEPALEVIVTPPTSPLDQLPVTVACEPSATVTEVVSAEIDGPAQFGSQPKAWAWFGVTRMSAAAMAARSVSRMQPACGASVRAAFCQRESANESALRA